MTPNFPSRLRVAIRSAGISQKMLADRAGCSSAAISRYLSGRDAPGEKMMQRLADALDTSVGFRPLAGISCFRISQKFLYSHPESTTTAPQLAGTILW